MADDRQQQHTPKQADAPKGTAEETTSKNPSEPVNPGRAANETESEGVFAEQIVDPDPHYPAHPERPQGVVVDRDERAAAGEDQHRDYGDARQADKEAGLTGK